MHVITSAEIDRVLTFPALIDALAEAFAHDVETPVRHHHEVDRAGQHGTLLLMPAWTGPTMRDGYLGVKVVTVFPENGPQGPPAGAGPFPVEGGGARPAPRGPRGHAPDGLAHRRRLGAGGPA